METSITICSQTLRTWLHKLRCVYKDIQKDVFVDRYEQSHVVENCINFLKKIEELKPYMVEFNKDGTIKPKAYPPDCAIKDENQQSIIIITYDKHTFSANNGIQKA